MAPDRMAIEWLDQTKTNLRFQHDYKRAFTRTVRELKSNFDGPRFQAKTHEPIIFPTLPVESVQGLIGPFHTVHSGHAKLKTRISRREF